MTQWFLKTYEIKLKPISNKEKKMQWIEQCPNCGKNFPTPPPEKPHLHFDFGVFIPITLGTFIILGWGGSHFFPQHQNAVGLTSLMVGIALSIWYETVAYQKAKRNYRKFFSKEES
jgi:hypothetical protein